ncbi:MULTISPECIES: hypothetical protein [Rhodopseudomonas]|nr:MULTISPECIES: hypothetical protein [Rhodopseudomonas]MDF3812769.1 hypothetical protein [Rhodopseudomonas sp. BAL398]WOK20344.1 hypothetical protein RBJ75_12845 [Rhodopseudomonas sp. BAL398]
MISEFRRLVVVSIALVLFLAAAQNAAGLNWRASPPVLMVANQQ